MSKLKIASNNLDDQNNVAVQQFLNWLTVTEEEVLHRTLTRFCLYKGAKIDISRVEFRIFEAQGMPNYCEYYYMGKIRGTDETKHVLMSRNLKVVPGQQVPVLEILFGKQKHVELENCFF